MIDSDLTLPSPGTQLAPTSQALLGLTVLWHPHPERVGEQAVLSDQGLSWQLNRFLPLFRAPGAAEGLPLGERCIGREPIVLERQGEDVLLRIPPGRMQVDLNGQLLEGEHLLSRAQLAQGAVLGLGGAVLLCLHWVQTLPRLGDTAGLIGVSSAMVRVREQIRQVADTDLAVLLLGETGTGKELAARAIHAASRRKALPWVSVNMATLSESLAAADLFGASKGAYTGSQGARQGYFAEAGGGTLFLDEIGNTPEAVQPMLLRVLETGEYRPLGAPRNELSQARLVAATDQRLDAGEFNQPLLRRLEAFVIRLPALRERREDIGLLIVHLLAQWQAQTGVAVSFEPGFVRELCCYDWPGNVRQLANVVRRAALARQVDDSPSLSELLGVVVGVAPLSAGLEVAGNDANEVTPVRRIRLAELSSAQLIDALEQQAWQIKGAAAVLGISRPSLYKLLEAHPDIRSADAIDEAELLAAWDASGGELTACASRLRTPSEALRRRLRALGCVA
ncbi:sigma 54-interacting transcriptional regulator [Chitinimonas sp.]|uniref:sigma 54-interacting transcriptional regulator n=1 Tax=Chitinimonas sp. TaxID=1934313 RepID=UPI002F928ED2